VAGAGNRCHADPAGGCVRNRLGITDRAVLVRVEAECAYGWDVLGYRVGPDLRRFSVDHLRGVHRW
jgi:fido (protein-threonine AMPylation protein)